ncbi:hypothetical protein BS47DRAFT_548232 [Hydnum rufescens UP504]|uniref:Uncharacterized protein n=1 Tax=Hydnum rufescens UP504 TaxID=1448309 RepID=A0A9P6B4B1_9AGAM|nr:hypothetical protein BS47DRAFT_548232 [Hydnum rufescens UP504]
MPPVNRGRWLARSRSVPVFPSSWMKNATPIPSRPAKLARTSTTELAHGNNTQNQGRSTSTNAQVAPPKATTLGQAPKVSASKDKDPDHAEPPSEQLHSNDISSHHHHHPTRQPSIKTSENLAAAHIAPRNATALPKAYTPPTPISRLTPVNRRAPKHLRPVPSITFTNLGVTQAPTPPSRSSPQRPLSQNISAPPPGVVGASEPSSLPTPGKPNESRVASAVENASFDTKDDVGVVVIEETPAVLRSKSILMPLANEAKTTEATPPPKPLVDREKNIMASTEGDHKVPIVPGSRAAAPGVFPETRSSLEKPSDYSATAPDGIPSASVNVTRHIPEVTRANDGETTSGINPFVRTPAASHRHTRNHSLGVPKEVPGEPAPKPETNTINPQAGATKTSRRQNDTTEAKPSRVQPPPIILPRSRPFHT